jgi:hypothetical protein
MRLTGLSLLSTPNVKPARSVSLYLKELYFFALFAFDALEAKQLNRKLVLFF